MESEKTLILLLGVNNSLQVTLMAFAGSFVCAVSKLIKFVAQLVRIWKFTSAHQDTQADCRSCQLASVARESQSVLASVLKT